MNTVPRLLAAAAVAASLALPAFAAENSYPADTTAPRAVVGPSLHQWKAMATVEAAALAEKLGTESGPWRVVAAPGADSAFSQAFTKMLVSELSARGVKLTTRYTGAVIELQLDGVPHAYDKRSYQPGTLSAIAAGVWVVKGLADVASGGVVATAVAVGADVGHTLLKDTKDFAADELAVTLVADNAGQLVASTTNVYLLNHQGREAYEDKQGQTLKFIK